MNQATSNRTRRGSNAVEFALIMPVLIAMLGGIIDTSWYLSQTGGVLQACRDGARSGAIEDDNDAVFESVATARASLDMLGFESSRATILPTIIRVGGDKAIQLDISYPHTNVFGLAAFSLPVDYTATAIYRLEDQS